jgi:3-carboxy-cis,cis-muconate cycloisomerase
MCMGATSQDVMDTGLVLQLRRAVTLIEATWRVWATPSPPRPNGMPTRHGRAHLVAARHAGHPGHENRRLAGRGDPHRQRLVELKPRLLVLQFGGASGTLAALGEQAMPVAEALAEQLQLTLPEQPWHTQRDRLVEFAAVLGLIAGSLGKFGRDISLLMQTEAAKCSSPRRRARAVLRPCRTSATRWARRC